MNRSVYAPVEEWADLDRVAAEHELAPNAAARIAFALLTGRPVPAWAEEIAAEILESRAARAAV